MNRILLIITICFLPCIAFGKSDLTKHEKAIVKTLKKRYKLEEVSVRHPYSDFTYYELLTKEFKWMIADSTGTVIIPQSKQTEDAYKNNIKFIQGHAKGVCYYRERGRNAQNIMAYYPESKPVFIAYKSIGGESNEYEFISVSGKVLKTFDGRISESFSAPVNICKDMAGNVGVMTMDGRILLPCEYISIEVRPDGICTLTQMQKGLERMGGACISDMTEMIVPCKFHYVDYSQSDKCWKVQIHKFDSLMVYDESKQYDTSFLDEGQMLFEQQLYEDARKYYTLTGYNAKWAEFFIGATYYISVQGLCDDMNNALTRLEESNNRQDRHIVTDIQGDLGLFRTETDKASQALQAYLEGGHSQYAAKAKEFLFELNEMQTNVAGIESRLGMALSDFDRRCTDHERKEQEEYNRRLEQQQMNLERQRLREQRLAREQRERDLRMRQRVEAERRQREARRREEERRKTQQKKQEQQVQQQQNKQDQQRPHRPVQKPQRKTIEQRNKELKEKSTPTAPQKIIEN